MNENNTKINWFPGHMAKSLKQMTDEITKVDMLIYVLDSRAPFSCINPKFEALKVNKPVLLKKNIIDRNFIKHSDLSEEDFDAQLKECRSKAPKSVSYLIQRIKKQEFNEELPLEQ